jgi:hypothetical protein
VSLAAAMQKYQAVHPGASKQDVINALKAQGIDYKDDVK